MEFIPVFLEIANLAGFPRKNANAIRNQGVCHVIYIFFGFDLDKV